MKGLAHPNLSKPFAEQRLAADSHRECAHLIFLLLLFLVLTPLAVVDVPEGNGPSRLVLEVDVETMLSEKIVEEARYSSSAASSAVNVLSRDSRWNLVTSLQTSLIGQTMAYLENLAALNSCNPFLFRTSSSSAMKVTTTAKVDTSSVSQKLQSWARNSGAAWETILRQAALSPQMVFNGVGYHISLSNAQVFAKTRRSVPFFVRGSSCAVYRTPSSERQTELRRSSRLFRLLSIADSENKPGVKTFFISEWQIFAVFIEEALAQVFFY